MFECVIAEDEERARVKRAFADARRAAGFASPAPQPYGVSPDGARLWVRDVMQHLGASDAEVTASRNEGFDVHSVEHLIAARVAHDLDEVPAEALRELYGVATATGQRAMLWTSGPVSRAGEEFAALAQIPVIHFDVEAGVWAPSNATGASALDALAASPA